MKYSQTLIDDEYESSNTSFQKEFLVISILITLGIPIYQLRNKLWTSLSLTYKNITGILSDGRE